MISGFFLALSASKEKPLPWYKFCIKRIIHLAPMILLVVLESLLFSGILYGVQGPEYFKNPFHLGTGVLWYIWYLWLAEFVIYPILIYAKKTRLFWVALIWIISFVGFFLVKYYGTFLPNLGAYTKIKGIPLELTEFLLSVSRSFSGIPFGIFIYQIVKKTYNARTSNVLKTIITIIGFLLLGAITYLMFWHYDSPLMFLLVLCFFLFLTICFGKYGWISPRIVLSIKAAKFCRTYSLILYFYHSPIISFIAAFWRVMPFVMAAGISFVCGLAISFPMYFAATRFDQVCQNLFFKIALSIKKKKEA